MKRFLANKLIVAWIAACAILLGTLAPSISFACMTSRNALPYGAEICHSADGVANSSAAAKTTPVSADHTHCQFCLIHVGHAALPSPAMPCCAPASAAAQLPSLFYQSPSPLFVWAAASPRGPPQRA